MTEMTTKSYKWDTTHSSGLQQNTIDNEGTNRCSDTNMIDLVDRAGNKFTRKLYKGFLWPTFSNLETNIENMHKLNIRPDDIIILAYPKCGTHWVWEVVNMLLRGNAEYINGIKEEQFLESASLNDIETSASPRVLNTHLFPHFLTPELINGRCKMIFVTRNPKDALLSMYQFHCVNRSRKYEGEFADYFDLKMTKNPDYLIGTWIEYTRAWEEHFNANPQLSVLYLFYEDMKEDLCREVKAIANFLSLPVDDRLVEKIGDKTMFEKMKEAKTRLDPTQSNMYRIGQVGRWKEHFTVAMSERYDNEYKQHMGDSRIAARIRFSL